MSNASLLGWERLRHRGLLLDTPRLQRVATHVPKALSYFHEEQLRRSAAAIVEGKGEISAFVSLVLEHVCGFSSFAGTWKRGSQVEGEWGRRAVTGEMVKPRHLWRGHHSSILPVFIDSETRLGLGRGRKAASQVVQWLRGGPERLALLTNGRQWRLIFAGLDFDAWCEWDVDLWFEEGKLSPQVTALRTLLSEALWIPERDGIPSPLLQAILDSRKGQADLSAALGERVREAVELLVQSHGEALKRDCPDVDPAEIYRAAVRVVMRMVVVLFAESRELLPRDNALYHGSYGLSGLLGELERVSTRGGNRLARSFSAWPRILSLFRLVHQGSHHPALPVPAYGGDLFALGISDAADGLSRALAVFEQGAYADELLPDRDVLQLLERITRTRIRVREGRQVLTVSAPVDFSDLSSEYIGILYEGLLDFELRTAPSGDPIVFLNVGNQPALPLSRLEQMDDKAIVNLLEKMKDKGKKSDEETGDEASEQDDDDEEEEADDVAAGDDGDEVPVAASNDEGDQDEDAAAEDERHVTRTRAEQWARRAVAIGKLVNRPKGTRSAEKEQAFDDAVGRKARQLVWRVWLPGEWYLVRWGGTRKGSGTFYTRPGLAVPTVQRTLRPLAYTPPAAGDGAPNVDAPAAEWTPRLPEEILAINVCDPACGSGTFPVAALRFLTDALYASLHHHQRIVAEGERSVVRLLGGVKGGANPERLSEELLPGRPDDADFEPRLKAILRRHVVERSIYGVDLDPLAVELCRLALWVETMDRRLPFSFLDHKIKCGNGLVGAWFDQFQHYPAMAWKNREGGDKTHSNGVHFAKETRTKAIKGWVKDVLVPDLQRFLAGRTLFDEDLQEKAVTVHDEALATLARVHDLPVQDSAERSRIYREDVLGSPAYARLKESMDLWCACWFWPVDKLASAPTPTALASPDDETRRVAARVAAKMRFFHWELEFPDVFRTSGSGFDAILGNPPWDIAKPNSKEFFSNIDPLYRSYGKQEAIEFQRAYFADAGVERAWLDYNADLRAQANAMGYLARPFGDPSVVDDAQDRFSIGKGKGSDALHASWRSARRKSSGYADPAHPYQHQGSADLNLYKLFLEQAHALLRAGGRLGFILPSGLYSDHGTGALRRLLLDRCQWEWLFGFENRGGIFAIHRSFKFNPIIVQKGGSTSAIRTAFMRRKLEDWERGEELARILKRERIGVYSPFTAALLELRDDSDQLLADRFYGTSQMLGEHVSHAMRSRVLSEIHKTNDSKLFVSASEVRQLRQQAPASDLRDPRALAWLMSVDVFPVFEGKSVHMYDNTWAEPAVLMRADAIAQWFQKKDSLDVWGSTVFSSPRLVFREVARPTDARSMIATILPERSLTTYTLRAIPFDPLDPPWLLLGILNSFAFDALTRMRGNLHLSTTYSQLPVGEIDERIGLEIVKRVRALMGPSLGPDAIAPDEWATDALTRTVCRAEIEALVACGLGLGLPEMEHLLRIDLDDPIGFWRVDEDEPTERRLPHISLSAFRHLYEYGLQLFITASESAPWKLSESPTCALAWAPIEGWKVAWEEARAYIQTRADTLLLNVNPASTGNAQRVTGTKSQPNDLQVDFFDS